MSDQEYNAFVVDCKSDMTNVLVVKSDANFIREVSKQGLSKKVFRLVESTGTVISI